MSLKNPLTPAGIEQATFRFVAQHLNHCATLVPTPNIIWVQEKGAQILLPLTVPINDPPSRFPNRAPVEIVGCLQSLLLRVFWIPQ